MSYSRTRWNEGGCPCSQFVNVGRAAVFARAAESLPGFPWRAHRRDDLPGFDGLAMSYLDEGNEAAPVFLCVPASLGRRSRRL
jgi:hypothetical protein